MKSKTRESSTVIPTQWWVSENSTGQILAEGDGPTYDYTTSYETISYGQGRERFNPCRLRP
jgi:hypothetical protein